MKILLITFLFFNFNLLADDFLINNEVVEFKDVDGLLVSNCSKNCKALELVKKHKKINLEEVRKGMKYANSSGSDVCARVYKANSILGQTKSKDGRAFCLFSDQSMIEMNSLSDYLVKKSIIKEK